jgi:hypothetical protein
MGRGDNRLTLKMRKRNAQARKKALLKAKMGSAAVSASPDKKKVKKKTESGEGS